MDLVRLDQLALDLLTDTHFNPLEGRIDGGVSREPVETYLRKLLAQSEVTEEDLAPCNPGAKAIWMIPHYRLTLLIGTFIPVFRRGQDHPVAWSGKLLAKMFWDDTSLYSIDKLALKKFLRRNKLHLPSKLFPKAGDNSEKQSTRVEDEQINVREIETLSDEIKMLERLIVQLKPFDGDSFKHKIEVQRELDRLSGQLYLLVNDGPPPETDEECAMRMKKEGRTAPEIAAVLGLRFKCTDHRIGHLLPTKEGCEISEEGKRKRGHRLKKAASQNNT